MNKQIENLQEHIKFLTNALYAISGDLETLAEQASCPTWLEEDIKAIAKAAEMAAERCDYE